MRIHRDGARDAGPRVCLDLGTAMSKASVWLGGDAPSHTEVAPLPIGAAAKAEHPLLTPSAMYVDDGRLFFGPAALQRAQLGVGARRNPIVSFKLILSARDIESTLALKLGRSIDPESTLRHRDALVLYLAYLDQLVRVAVAAESAIPMRIADAPRRITSPHWQSFEEARRVMGDLLEESVVVSALLGTSVLEAEGVPLQQVRQALIEAQGAPRAGMFEGVVFESDCAAAAYASFAVSNAPFVMVIDMGAGTTDIAGFSRAHDDALVEIPGTRQCCALAGDELDNILVDIAVRNCGVNALDAQDQLWRSVKLSAKELKAELFQRGERTFKYAKRRIRLTRKTLLNDPSFKAYAHALKETFAHSLAPVLARAKGANASSVTVLLAGGGANLPFMPALVRAAALKSKTKLRVHVERFGANWTLPHRHHPLTGVFPQLAISMGGALAPLVQDAVAESQLS